jgi:hypothetical protein
LDTSLPPQRNSRALGAGGLINALQSPAPIFTSGSFIYKGNDERLKSVMTTDQGSTTTYFVGNYYEPTDSVATKYYYAGSQRIAMRVGGTLSFLMSDHLGSTSLSTDANGTVTSEQRYTACPPALPFRVPEGQGRGYYASRSAARSPSGMAIEKRRMKENLLCEETEFLLRYYAIYGIIIT